MHNYENGRQRLPPIGMQASSQWAFSVQSLILPLVEEASLQSLVNFA